jgi:hypothetical protein
MDGVIPVRSEFVEPGDQQPVTFDHYLGVAGFHREFEVMEIVLAGDTGELECTLDHAEGCVAETIHDAVA